MQKELGGEVYNQMSNEEWSRLLVNQYLDYKEGRMPLDPMATYKLSQLLQTCVHHEESYHKDCIYFDALKGEAWLVKGNTIHIHQDNLHSVPMNNREPLRINMDVNLLEPGREAEPKAIAFGAGFPQREFQWYFCDKCFNSIELKQDLLNAGWTKGIVEKYMSIWVDWYVPPLY